jgi:hypothetical protein
MKPLFLIVILSGVFLDEGEKNEVEGSHAVWLSGECPEILRLRNPTLRVELLRTE